MKYCMVILVGSQNVMYGVVFIFSFLESLIGYFSIILVKRRMALNLCSDGRHESFGIM
jgi:hypothetical protein